MPALVAGLAGVPEIADTDVLGAQLYGVVWTDVILRGDSDLGRATATYQQH